MEAKWVKDRDESVKGIRKINRWWDQWQEVPGGAFLTSGPRGTSEQAWSFSRASEESQVSVRARG